MISRKDSQLSKRIGRLSHAPLSGKISENFQYKYSEESHDGAIRTPGRVGSHMERDDRLSTLGGVEGRNRNRAFYEDRRRKQDGGRHRRGDRIRRARRSHTRRYFDDPRAPNEERQ